MKQYLRQFTGWATDLMHNPFERARIKLTVYYLISTVIVTGIFSVLLISTLEKNLRDSFEEIIDNNHTRNEVFIRTKDGLEASIFLADGVIILLVGSLGYLLAGRTLSPIKEAMDRQKRFTADASHDLRTPLTILKTGMEVALQNKTQNPDMYKEVLKSGLEEIKTMSFLTEDLLTLARSESDSKSSKEQIDLGECIKKIVARISHQAARKSINLNLNIKENGKVLINESLLTRAVQNVIQNAINYTQEGGQIDVVLSKDKKHLKLSIKDNGTGISSDDLPYIFERFYKASHSRSDNNGSGLGLSITKEIIEKSGGTVVINSEVHKGTEVIIKIPS
ncbi:MAG: histidine kinase [Candidatus Nomurabacteria bacterium]|nr:histidine kinase [Candidatus Nomurabacteria bacterium]